MNYYDEIKNELIKNEINRRVKNYSINRSDLNTYFNVGRMLNEAGKHYGEGIIKEYSKRLEVDLNVKYDVSSLNKMRKFYNLSEKMATLSPNLSYSHYVELLPYDDINKITYYIKICEQQNLSVRKLRAKIRAKEYERLPLETKNKLVAREESSVVDFVKNPIQLKNNKNLEITSEKVLKSLILENMQSFMNELGSSFSFIGSEYPIKLGNQYNYIDILLYNIKFKCYVVVELKVTELKKDHIGQIMTYMNYIDNNIKTIEENKTAGIIICKQDNKYVIKYCSDDRIVSREYVFI